MHILVLTCDFYPTGSSVASCMKPLLLSLEKDGHNVHVVTNNGITNENNSININGISVHRIVDEYANKAREITNFVINLTLNQYFQVILRKFLKLPYYIRYVLFTKKQRMNSWSITKSVDLCLDLDKIYNFDLIISTSQPFTSHLIATQFKKQCVREIKWVVYQFDPYSYNATVSQTKSNISKLRKLESDVLEAADTIILAPELYEYYKSTDFVKYFNKMQPLSYIFSWPFKEWDSKQELVLSSVDLLFVYAGEFYKDIRNPQYALQMFSSLGGNFKLLFLTNYREKQFLKMVKSFPNSFEVRKQIPQEEAFSWLAKADFLVSVGNTVEMQVPAKIFEYMSLGKPIIHFSKIPNDPAIKYLKLYPIVLIIKEYETNDEYPINMLVEFIKKYKNISVNNEEIKNCLANLDEKVVTREFLSIIEER